MTCEDCRFYGSCYMQERFEDDIVYTENAESMCKNFEEYCLPAKHGRLIDENDVLREIRRFKGYLDEDMIWRIEFAIKNRTKTIIEAEDVNNDES